VKERMPSVMCSPVVGTRRVMFRDAGGVLVEKFEGDGFGKGMLFKRMVKWIALLGTWEKSTKRRAVLEVVALPLVLAVLGERVVFTSTPEAAALPVVVRAEEFVLVELNTGDRSYGTLTNVQPSPGNLRTAFVRGSVILPRQPSVGPVGVRAA